jgi:hypothetical protein
MKTKALVTAVDRPQVAAFDHWLVTVIYTTAQGFKRKNKLFTKTRPNLHEWIVIDTRRTVSYETEARTT